MSRPWLENLHSITRYYYPGTSEEIVVYYVGSSDDLDAFPEILARCSDPVHCRLFAAAPDLYEALENLLPLVDSKNSVQIDKAMKALEKARPATGRNHPDPQ